MGDSWSVHTVIDTLLFQSGPTYRDRAREGLGGVDEDEDTTAVELELNELARLADSGKLVDIKTLVLLQTLRLRRPELFLK